MMHTKFQTQEEIFPDKKIKRIKIDTKKIRVCELSLTHETYKKMAYRQIVVKGKMKWGCDHCIAELCNRSSDNIDRNQRVLSSWM